jgi:DNA-binding response OmpR family regulator
MLLKVLMREPGRVFTRTELSERVWEHAHEYDTKLVEVFIGRLRKKLGEPSLIHTIRHVGYTIAGSEGKTHVRRGTNSKRRG